MKTNSKREKIVKLGSNLKHKIYCKYYLLRNYKVYLSNIQGHCWFLFLKIFMAIFKRHLRHSVKRILHSETLLNYLIIYVIFGKFAVCNSEKYIKICA